LDQRGKFEYAEMYHDYMLMALIRNKDREKKRKEGEGQIISLPLLK
jgi:hypothetical protein